jgi:predicted enzyme related to lactoylglutathione lyase
VSNHPIVHIEIPAKKAEEAGKFYGDLFGWKIEADPRTTMYSLWRKVALAEALSK